VLAEHRILSAPVTADGEVLGFVDIRDILAAFLKGVASFTSQNDSLRI